MSDARNVVELLPRGEDATVAVATVAVATVAAVAVPRAPKAPDVGDPVEKWEGWIARCAAYMKEKGLVHRSVDALFADYREREIKHYGARWATVVREGNDVHHLKSMEVEWKWLSYLALKGRLPSFSRYTCRRSYRR